MTDKAAAVDPRALGAFLDDHVAYFDWSFTAAMGMPRAQLDVLHAEGVRCRFDELRNEIAVLKTLADAQGLRELTELNDVVPLLFPHSVYKSFPVSLIHQNRWDLITQWLGKLTAHDLSGVDTTGVDGLDAWLDRMDERSPLLVGHSSGTTGSVSLIPCSKEEFDLWGRQMAMVILQKMGDPRPTDPVGHLDVIYPYFRSGG
ncbi:MAG: hypothetical protein ACYDHH_33705, partial [Solirubrobacteraceae bacterium]